MKAAFSDATSQMGALASVFAAIVCETGATPRRLLSEASDVINNNLNGTANTIRAFDLKLIKRGQGRIIVLTSMQGKHGSKV